MPKHLSLMDCPIHEKRNFSVPGYSVDHSKQLSLPGLIEQLQEAALLSTQRLGVSVFDLEPHQLAWVLIGQRINILRRPKLAENCSIITAPVGFERVLTFRDFHLLDASGGLLVTATTTWMLIDTKKRRMASFPDWIKKIDEQTPPAAAHLPRATYKLQPPVNPEFKSSFKVGFHELDFNGHLTNPIYVRWMLEALPLSLLESGNIAQLDIQFNKEARHGDDLQVGIMQTDHDGVYHHGLFRGKDCLASMQTIFR